MVAPAWATEYHRLTIDSITNNLLLDNLKVVELRVEHDQRNWDVTDHFRQNRSGTVRMGIHIESHHHIRTFIQQVVGVQEQTGQIRVPRVNLTIRREPTSESYNRFENAILQNYDSYPWNNMWVIEAAFRFWHSVPVLHLPMELRPENVRGVRGQRMLVDETAFLGPGDQWWPADPRNEIIQLDWRESGF